MYLVGLRIYYKMIHGPYNIKSWILYRQFQFRHSCAICRHNHWRTGSFSFGTAVPLVSTVTDVPHTVRDDDLLFLSNGTNWAKLFLTFSEDRPRSISLLLNTKCNEALRGRCSLHLILTNNLVSFFSVIHSNIILSLTPPTLFIALSKWAVNWLTHMSITYIMRTELIQGVSFIVSAITTA